MAGILYLVGTPIGNLEDITLRALRILKEVDIVACEDTRHTLAMLNYYEIKKPLVSYYKHKEYDKGNQIIRQLEDGKNVALVTDAGMPCISDPGSVLVNMARQHSIETYVVPGACAVVSAFALTGIDTVGFSFLGFLPDKNKDRVEYLLPFKNLQVPIILYCSPHSILTDIKFLYKELGNRQVYVIKELTKIYETVYVGDLETIEIANTRGEFVVIIAPNEDENPLLVLTIKEHILHYIGCGMEKKESIKQVAKDRKLPKNDVYKEALDI